MEVFISALGVIISFLMESPSLITKNKKTQIGGILKNLVLSLDVLISQAIHLLNKLELLPITTDKFMFQKHLEELERLSEKQICDVRLFERMVKNYLLESDELSTDAYARKADVHKIMAIYEPNLGYSILKVIEIKGYILEKTLFSFSDNIENINMNNLTIQKVTEISSPHVENLNKLLLSGSKIKDLVEQGLIQIETVNLQNVFEFNQYIFIERGRLEELQTSRKKLADLIKEKFEITDIL